jgi:hypothetical protein
VRANGASAGFLDDTLGAVRASFVTAVLAAAAWAAALSPAQADVIELKSGAPVIGKVWEKGDAELVYNAYRTAIRKVTFGVEKLAAKSVKRVVDDPDPHRSFWRKAGELRDGKADEWVALGLEARAKKLQGLARFAFTEALVRDPVNAAAQKELGSKLKEIQQQDPRLNAPLREKLAAYLGLADAAARQKAFDELKTLGCAWPDWYTERAWRSAKEKRGRTEDRLLTLRSRENKGVYTLFVPESYDPWKPTPLVIGLHGGGRGGKDGKAVVGSGPGAMNFYQRGAERLGWIVVCPTAIEAPWAAKSNDPFLMAILEEVSRLFNVDKNRVYLTGHSMGGFGTWHFAPLYAHLWAAVAPMAGGGGGSGLKRLQDTLTGVYLYHGANDPVVGVGDDHATAVQMKDRDMDFAYAEIPDSGHGFPPEVEAEMWDFFEVRRLAVAPGGGEKGKFAVTEEPSPSFLAKPTKEELDYLGPLGKPAAKDEGSASSALKPLIADLKAGGGLAQKAAEKLSAMHEPEAATQVAAVLANATLAPDCRKFAAEALGGMKRVEGAKALQAALSDPSLDVLGAAAWAFGRVGAAAPAKAYERCVTELKQRFDKKLVGTKMEYSDFESHFEVLCRLADGAAASGDAACGPVLLRVGNEFLLPSLSVDASERAGQNPATPRRRLAKALVEACATLKDKSLRPLLESLSKRSDLGVESEAKEVLGRL